MASGTQLYFSLNLACSVRVQVVNYVIFEYSRPQLFEDTDNNVDNVEELTTDRSAATKPSSLSPQPQPSGTRIVGERPTTVRAPAAQGEGKITF